MCIPGDASSDEIKEVFDKVAKEIFTNYHINKNGEEYYFLEIEFYFCNKKHPDIITYPRDMDACRWFFHKSGIDLTFQSSYSRFEGKDGMVDVNHNFAFGGILIRKILKKNTGQSIDGPNKCEWELFDNFDAFGTIKNEYPILERNKKTLDVTYSTSRRTFSYSKNDEKMKKKYDELNHKVFADNVPASRERFCEFIQKELFAYEVEKEHMVSKL